MSRATAARRKKVEVKFVEIAGRSLAIMSEKDYEALLDDIDAADAERIANDESDRILTWDEIKDEFMRNRIAEVRKELGMTQKELAKKLRVKQSTVSRMERNEANLTLATLRRAAKALKRPVHELLY